MELHVVATEGIPEGCVLSVRAGATRRQAPVSADRPFRFPTTSAEAMPFKVDVLEPVASARLILRPGDERRTDCQYTIPLEPASSSTEAATDKRGADKGEGGGKAAEQDPETSVTFSVRPTEEQLKKEEENAKKAELEATNEGTSRPASSKGLRVGSSVSSRVGQANAAREYLDQHNLVEFTQLLVQSVIKEQPERPYEFMAKQFYFPEPKPRPGTVDGASKMATSGAPSPTPCHAGTGPVRGLHATTSDTKAMVATKGHLSNPAEGAVTQN